MQRKAVKTQDIALMMEAANTSKTSVNFCQTTRRYNPEDTQLHSSSCFLKHSFCYLEK
jgi:hypothetical protein